METPSPLLTVLNYSGGKQSSALLWMVLRGELNVDLDTFIVLNADPGMERTETYKYVEMMKVKCDEAGIFFKTVKGPNLYEDLVAGKWKDVGRLDNPPYWTKSSSGHRGRLMQKCTRYYKVAPMDQEIRRILEERYAISRTSTRIGEKIVRKWIGFTVSEVHRIKPSPRKYIEFVYPLIDLGMSNQDVLDWYEKNQLPIPLRSVCNACFANGLNTFRDMHATSPEDWAQAVAVDDAVRDMTPIGVTDEVFVSETRIPLRVLAQEEFETGDDKEQGYSCDSGYCFT